MVAGVGHPARGAPGAPGADTLRIHTTDVCGDIRTAAGADFSQVPSATTTVVAAFARVQSGAGWPELFTFVAPYENASLRQQAAALRALQTKLDNRLNAILEPQLDRLGTVLLGPGA